MRASSSKSSTKQLRLILESIALRTSRSMDIDFDELDLIIVDEKLRSALLKKRNETLLQQFQECYGNAIQKLVTNRTQMVRYFYLELKEEDILALMQDDQSIQGDKKTQISSVTNIETDFTQVMYRVAYDILKHDQVLPRLIAIERWYFILNKFLNNKDFQNAKAVFLILNKIVKVNHEEPSWINPYTDRLSKTTQEYKSFAEETFRQASSHMGGNIVGCALPAFDQHRKTGIEMLAFAKNADERLKETGKISSEKVKEKEEEAIKRYISFTKNILKENQIIFGGVKPPPDLKEKEISVEKMLKEKYVTLISSQPTKKIPTEKISLDDIINHMAELRATDTSKKLATTVKIKVIPRFFCLPNSINNTYIGIQSAYYDVIKKLNGHVNSSPLHDIQKEIDKRQHAIVKFETRINGLAKLRDSEVPHEEKVEKFLLDNELSRYDFNTFHERSSMHFKNIRFFSELIKDIKEGEDFDFDNKANELMRKYVEEKQENLIAMIDFLLDQVGVDLWGKRRELNLYQKKYDKCLNDIENKRKYTVGEILRELNNKWTYQEKIEFLKDKLEDPIFNSPKSKKKVPIHKSLTELAVILNKKAEVESSHLGKTRCYNFSSGGRVKTPRSQNIINRGTKDDSCVVKSEVSMRWTSREFWKDPKKESELSLPKLELDLVSLRRNLNDSGEIKIPPTPRNSIPKHALLFSLQAKKRPPHIPPITLPTSLSASSSSDSSDASQSKSSTYTSSAETSGGSSTPYTSSSPGGSTDNSSDHLREPEEVKTPPVPKTPYCPPIVIPPQSSSEIISSEEKPESTRRKKILQVVGSQENMRLFTQEKEKSKGSVRVKSQSQKEKGDKKDTLLEENTEHTRDRKNTSPGGM